MHIAIVRRAIAIAALFAGTSAVFGQPAQEELYERFDEIQNRFTIVSVFDRHGNYFKSDELELTDEQRAIIRDLRDRRYRAQFEDYDEFEFAVLDPAPSAGNAVLRQIREREREREARDIKVLQETLLDIQQKKLGELLIRDRSFDALANPFTQQILPISQRQLAQLYDLQLQINAQVRILSEHSRDHKAIKRELRKLAPKVFEAFEILRVDQLEEYFTIRGKIKEGQTLESFVESLPADCRLVCERALEAKRKEKERR